MNEITIDIVLLVPPLPDGASILPSGKMPEKVITKISKAFLVNSLNHLVPQVGEILFDANVESNVVQTDSIAISAEITSESGIQ